jgi:hypothetical protein
MARIAGRGGRAYVGLASSSASAEPVAFIAKWNIDSDSERYDVTSQGDTSKAYVQGLPDAKGSFSGFFDVASAQLYTAAADGLARKTYLYPDQANNPGVYWFGTAFWSFSVDVPVDGAAAVSGSWAAATPFQKVG